MVFIYLSLGKKAIYIVELHEVVFSHEQPNIRRLNATNDSSKHERIERDMWGLGALRDGAAGLVKQGAGAVKHGVEAGAKLLENLEEVMIVFEFWLDLSLSDRTVDEH